VLFRLIGLQMNKPGDNAGLKLQVSVISLFPEMVQEAAGCGVVGRALQNEVATLACINPRRFTSDAHQTVDDRPYGGGPGMVLKAEPFACAIEAAQEKQPGSPVIFLGPQGRAFDQQVARKLAEGDGMILVAGRYEGFDERLIEEYADDELSLGDYVLSGGELAALVVIDAVVRLLPGVLGDDASAQQDSFSSGLLDYPHYTRPDVFKGQGVPDVLTGGNHARIERWRMKQALGRTWSRRPDLLEDRTLGDAEQELLQEYVDEYNARNDPAIT
jgi:tRNA (guanine37-N1)-methyltransferase